MDNDNTDRETLRQAGVFDYEGQIQLAGKLRVAFEAIVQATSNLEAHSINLSKEEHETLTDSTNLLLTLIKRNHVAISQHRNKFISSVKVKS